MRTPVLHAYNKDVNYLSHMIGSAESSGIRLSALPNAKKDVSWLLFGNSPYPETHRFRAVRFRLSERGVFMIPPQSAEVCGEPVPCSPRVYDNNAQQLAAVFETTHSPVDFSLAEEAFRQRQSQHCLTYRDLLCWAESSQLNGCMEQSLALYAQIPDADDPICRTARRRYVHLLIRMDKHTPVLDAYLKSIIHSQDAEEWLELICTYQEARRFDDALHWLHLARDRFPEHPMVCYWGGVICQAQQRWHEALAFWRQALTLDPDFTDAAYGCAQCREHLA